MYAYFNAIICILDNNKGGGVLPSSRFTYKARTFFLEKNDSPAVLIYVLLLILIGYVSAAPEAFMVPLDETVMFFYDNGFYILNKEVDSPFCQKEAFLGFIFCKGRNYFNTLKSWARPHIVGIKELIMRFCAYWRKLNANEDFLYGSYAGELAVIISLASLALIFFSFNNLDHFCFEDSLFFIQWWRLLHIIAANFFCWLLVYNLLQSVWSYRAAFILYVIIERFWPYTVFKYIWVKVYIVIYHFFGGWSLNQLGTRYFFDWNVNLASNIYSLSYGLAFWIFFAWIVYVGFVHRHETFFLMDFRNPLNGRNSALFDKWIYKCYVISSDLITTPRAFASGLSFILLFYVFGPGFPRLFDVNHTPLWFAISIFNAFDALTYHYVVLKAAFFILFAIWLFNKVNEVTDIESYFEREYINFSALTSFDDSKKKALLS